MGSKYQNQVKTAIKEKKKNPNNRPKYYDEKISTSKKSSFPAIFIIGIVVLGFGVFGVGKLIENAASPPDSNDINTNANFQETNSEDVEQSTGSTYLTPLVISDIDGRVYNLADYEGKVVVIYFHYLECSACITHSPNLNTAKESFTDDELLVITITVDPQDSVSELQTWESNGGYDWVMVRDDNGALASYFSVRYTPHMVYLDPSGAQTSAIGAKSASEIITTIQNLL